MAMKTPVHPGAIVREDCLKPLRLSVYFCPSAIIFVPFWCARAWRALDCSTPS